MSRFYHPQESSGPVDAGGGGPAGSGIEMSNAGLSAGVEMHIQAPIEASSSQFAQQAFDIQSAGQSAMSQAMGPRMEALLPNTSIGGFEAAALGGPIPGADSTLMAGLIPGANEPLSPLIQLILRMPGAMGLMHSVVDFFAAFFSHASHNLFNLFDPSFLATQAQGALGDLAKNALNHGHGVVGLSQHFPISLSLLPSNSPIFQSLGMNGIGPLMNGSGSELLSAKLGGFAQDHMGASFNNNFNVSGQLDPSKAQFEQMGASGMGAQNPQLAGPSLSDSVGKGHLAGNSRLFSDQITTLKGNQQTFISNASTPTTPNSLSSASAPQTNALPSSFNVNSNALGQSASSMPAVGRLEDGLLNGPATPADAGYSVGTPGSSPMEGGPDLGPSGAVSNRLGGQQLLADSRGVDTFRPSYGNGNQTGAGMERSVSDMQPRSADSGYGGTTSDTTAAASKATHPPIGGMKAKQLSLDGIDKTASAKSSAAAKAPQADPKASQAAQSTQSTMDGISHGHKAGHEALPQTGDHVSHGKGGSHATGKSHDNVAHRVTPKVQYDDHARHVASVPEVHHAAKHAAAAPQQAQETYQPQEQAPATQDQSVQSGQGAAVDANGNPVEQAQAAQEIPPTEYTIKSGDCLWDIAKDHLGNAGKWHEVYDMNKDVLGSNPDLIRPGTTIHLPGSNELASQVSGEVTKYVVKPGDNLWNISKDMMGGGDKWGQLYQMNHDVIGANPRMIFPGQELNIPSADGASNVMASGSVDPSQQMAQAAGQQPAAGGQDMAAAAPDGQGAAQGGGTSIEQGVAQYDTMPGTQGMPPNPNPSMPPTQNMPASQAQPAAPNGLPSAALPPQGLPVLPAQTPTPILMTPAQAATPVADSASVGVVTSNVSTHLADYLRKNK